jgi:hypothetical protein
MTTITDVLDPVVDNQWPDSEEELASEVVPMQINEFFCSGCFLIHHRSQLAARRRDQMICRDCA